MDFDFTEEQQMLKASVRNFLEKEIAPLVNEHEKKGPLTKAETLGFIKQLLPFGFLSGFLPEKYGGSQLEAKTNGILVEELSRVWGSLAGTIFIAAGFLWVLNEAGSPEQKERLLPLGASGEYIGCLAITEPNAGSDVSSLETVATLEGNNYLLNGTKTWISNGSIADAAFVLATTDKTLGPLGMAFFLVEKNKSNFTARELHKLGMRSFPTSELSFDDCKVPKESALDPGAGYKRTMAFFDISRAMVGAMCSGISQAAIDASIKYAQERTQFGRPIGSFQMIQEMLVDMITETEAGRLLSFRALDLLDKGQKCRWQSSLAKAYATEAAVRTTSKAIQIHGAMGLSDEFAVERYFRDARTMTIPDGTTQMQKLIVGRDILGIRALVWP
ncbi:MAG TPA: acyl-CoA dehydrogenase family protein [Dehalococcoidia bacterium]|nr:acyl-CoA dehydrogenase family protein [Dehalococcoidia bacterium]